MSFGRRATSESNIYHVMARGVGGSIIFEDDDDRQSFVELLSNQLKQHPVKLHAWCLMDNHYHLLLEGEMRSISSMMRTLGSDYARIFNERHYRVGHLFQGRFRSEPVDSDEYYLTVLRYIHQNPVNAGVSSSCDYPWSSYNDYIDNPRLVDNSLVLSLLGKGDAFLEFHQTYDQANHPIDVDGRRRNIDTESLLRIARDAVPGIRIEEIAGLERIKRDEALRALKGAHLTLRQIERLTGVSKSIVGRA